MIDPRPATIDDVDMLARLHVQAWQEAYPGLLPADEIAARTYESRQFIWTRILSLGQSRVWVMDDLGFAQFGPQREDIWRDQGYSEELYAMYLIRDGYGLGRPLINAAFGAEGQPFTACVLQRNDRACAFYKKAGGALLLTREDQVGASAVTERIYGWVTAPFATTIKDREQPDHKRPD